jgi:hypothetical protein
MELADDRAGLSDPRGASTPCSTARDAVVGGDRKTKFAILHNRFLPERSTNCAPSWKGAATMDKLFRQRPES